MASLRSASLAAALAIARIDKGVPIIAELKRPHAKAHNRNIAIRMVFALFNHAP
jgi:hypothetical protein